jgi:hypothetical protein
MHYCTYDDDDARRRYEMKMMEKLQWLSGVQGDFLGIYEHLRISDEKLRFNFLKT